MAFLIVRYRLRINVRLISIIIKSLGVILGFIGLYFALEGVQMIFNLKIW